MAVRRKVVHGQAEGMPEYGDEVRYAISLVKQGTNRFYTLTMPSNVLAACAYVSAKDLDPAEGFQRVLDKGRAEEIAAYIDGGGSIPNSIVLSAQSEANFRSVDRAKTAAFNFLPKSFLILDGQHRVFGFSFAETSLRVPVVIYDGLSKEQEARLFIDINTKQRPVPKELLLSIKSMANSETDTEARLGQIFDLFDQQNDSALISRTSSTKKAPKKIDRVTFNAGLRTHLGIFEERTVSYVYDVWNAYFHAVLSGLREKKIEEAIAKKVTFRAFCQLFPDVVQRVQDRFKSKYTADNFAKVLKPVFTLVPGSFSSPNSIDQLADSMRKRLRAGLMI